MLPDRPQLVRSSRMRDRARAVADVRRMPRDSGGTKPSTLALCQCMAALMSLSAEIGHSGCPCWSSNVIEQIRDLALADALDLDVIRALGG